MTYRLIDTTVKQGRPFFLYQFASGATVTRLTSDAAGIVRQSVLWTPSPVSHQELEQTGNVEKNKLELTFPLSDTFAYDYLLPATGITTVTIMRGHHGDVDEELSIYWKGRIVGAKSTKQNIIMTVENVFTSLRRPGCRVRVQRTCRHDHYGLECGVNKASFAIACTITAVSGLMLTVPAAGGYAAGTFNAGFISWNGLNGFIDSHSGAACQIISEIPGMDDAILLGALSATIYPGCNRNLTGSFSCAAFSNHLNFGGFRWIPDANPFNTSII